MRKNGKKILLVLLALMPCFQTTLMAEEPEYIPVKNAPDHKETPRLRSIAVPPVCQYYNGIVSIQADNDITYITACVTRLDDSMQWSNAGAGNTLSINVSTDPGTYLLTLTLSDGRSYYGEYTLY